jgi:isoquinoline 1-oxidoreductase beta subunit
MTTALLDASRRSFLAGSATGIAGFVLGFHVPLGMAGAAEVGTAPAEINAWVVVQPDETVVIRIARSEMGQGTLTGLAQLVAEELDCDWSKVTTEYPSPGQNLARDRVWGNFSTGGSRGIRESHEYVRKGGAAAREMLVRAAAQGWGVAPAECSATEGVIAHAPSGRTTTYGKVAAVAATLEPPQDVALKPLGAWKIAGRPMKRLDTAEKLTGKQVYGIDLKLPGMLNAAIRDCPVFGGRVRAVDAEAVAGRPGVRRVVQVGETAVAVVAETWWQAKTALDALPITWDEGPNTGVSSATIAALLTEGLDAEEAFVGNHFF